MKDLCYKGTIEKILDALTYPFTFIRGEDYYILVVSITSKVQAYYKLDLNRNTYSPYSSYTTEIVPFQEAETIRLYLQPFENCLNILGFNKTMKP